MAGSKATYKIYGYSFYDNSGKKGFYLNLAEDYLDRDGAVGSFSISMSAPYAEIERITAVKMSIDKPATVEIMQVQQPMGRSLVVMCQELISITPFNPVELLKTYTPAELAAVTQYLKQSQPAASAAIPPQPPK